LGLFTVASFLETGRFLYIFVRQFDIVFLYFFEASLGDGIDESFPGGEDAVAGLSEVR
jgi:hypothetical protein